MWKEVAGNTQKQFRDRKEYQGDYLNLILELPEWVSIHPGNYFFYLILTVL